MDFLLVIMLAICIVLLAGSVAALRGKK